MLEDSIFVRGVNFEAPLGEHPDKRYTSLNDVHGFLRTHLNDSLIAPALTMHGHVKVEVDEHFELSTILESKSIQRGHLTLKFFGARRRTKPRRFLCFRLLIAACFIIIFSWLVSVWFWFLVGGLLILVG